LRSATVAAPTRVSAALSRRKLPASNPADRKGDADMKLIISNKPYSPWPMRVWLLMRQLDVAFDEEVIDLSANDKAARLRAVSPSGRVPVLVDGDVRVWDSMAIIEYLHERFPHLNIWPRETAARAHARAISNEMHSGFAALRGRLIMNTRRDPKP